MNLFSLSQTIVAIAVLEVAALAVVAVPRPNFCHLRPCTAQGPCTPIRHDMCFKNWRSELLYITLVRLWPLASTTSRVAAKRRVSGNLGNAHAIKLVANIPIPNHSYAIVSCVHWLLSLLWR
ncbi:hypothetical protein GQ44DRAFT_400549 [Phaeosphaeriaceae sp. PMI808]|nr:hypothetical protein GQ44DRAFT_400549 [Phaeosphaeriaceae sp. PMI808]